MSFKWERLDDCTFRANVFGGWIVRYSEEVIHDIETQGLVDGWDWRTSLVFVPDPEHKWLLE